jgi:hypothetical protein
MSEDAFEKGFKGGAGTALGVLAAAAGVGVVCLICPPLAIPAAKVAAIGVAASQGRDISGSLSG